MGCLLSSLYTLFQKIHRCGKLLKETPQASQTIYKRKIHGYIWETGLQGKLPANGSTFIRITTAGFGFGYPHRYRF